MRPAITVKGGNHVLLPLQHLRGKEKCLVISRRVAGRLVPRLPIPTAHRSLHPTPR